jgi:phospholipase C
MHVISPWSRGGWVNSQVFDHTSVGQFLERRFGITIPAISPWHRAVCGDLTSAFDFGNPNAAPFPELPTVSNSAAMIAAIARLPKPAPPDTPEPLFQEPGVRRSRALPYELHVHANAQPGANKLSLTFRNTGKAGAVFHTYDRLHLDRIPRRYTIESGKTLADEWLLLAEEGRYDLWVYGPNGFVREFRGALSHNALTAPEVELEYDVEKHSIRLMATNEGHHVMTLVVRVNAYRADGPWPLPVARGRHAVREWELTANHHWYDFTVTGERFERRFAGRMETGMASFSDPAV